MAIFIFITWVFPIILLMYSVVLLKQLRSLKPKSALGLALLGGLSVMYTAFWMNLWGGVSYTPTIDIAALVYFLIPTYLALALGAVLIIAGCYRYVTVRKCGH